MSKIIYILQDLNPNSPTFSNTKEVGTDTECNSVCPPKNDTEDWLPMLHEWGESEALSWSPNDDDKLGWRTPIFYNLTGKNVWIDWDDGSAIEKTDSLIVSHVYPLFGYFSPKYKFEDGEEILYDYTYYYGGQTDYTIIAPILANFNIYGATYLRVSNYKQYLKYNDYNWEIVIPPETVDTGDDLYIFNNDKSYGFKKVEENNTDFEIKFSQDIFSVNHNSFTVFNVKNNKYINQFSSMNFEIDNTCIIINGENKTRLRDCTKRPYGEIIGYVAGKKFRYVGCKQFLNISGNRLKLNFIDRSGENVNMTATIKLGDRDIILTNIMENEIVLTDEELELLDDFTITIFLDKADDLYVEQYDLGNKIMGFEFSKY